MLQPQSSKVTTEAGASHDFSWLECDPARYSRQSTQVYALELERMLWGGFGDRALPRLNALIECGPSAEKAVAGWVLARWHLAEQDYWSAYQAIIAFHDSPECQAIFAHPGPFLLGIHIFAACKAIDRAGHVLAQAIERFGETPDLSLAHIELALAKGEPEWAVSSILENLYRRAGLAPVSVAQCDGHLFDRLRARHTGVAGTSQAVPLVSVIVPAYNSAETLQTALRGLRDQSWSNLEILVVDDGSSDRTLEMATIASNEDARVRAISLGGNTGAYNARNVGFHEARGTFVTVHDADDWSHPQKIEIQARALVEDPLMQASVSHWARAGNALEMTGWRIEHGWIHRNVSSLMVRSTLRDSLGYWDRVRVNADTEYYYRILHAYGPGAIGEVCPGVPMALGRGLPGSLTSKSLTHLRTQFEGVRRDYMEAAHEWHSRATTAGDLYVPQRPETRPFRAPGEIALDPIEPSSSDFDLLATCELVDEEWYLIAYPDVMQSGTGAARHFLIAGARENRDPGPAFSTSGYRHAFGLDADENPLLHYLQKGKLDGAECLPAFKGKLPWPETGARIVLVFAHTAGDTLFGAERSLLDVVKSLAREGLLPVVVLPGLRNSAYLESLLEICVAVQTLPQVWRHGLHPPPERSVEVARALIRKYRPIAVHVNTVVLEVPLMAAHAEGIESVVYVREMPAEDQALCRSLGMSARAVRNRLLEQADRFVVPSKVVADWLAYPERCTVRPNAVDEALFDLPFTPGSILKVALISSNIFKKGIEDAVEVARIVAATGWPVHFLLIGPQTKDLDALDPLPPNASLRGYAKNPAEAVAQADIILSLSHFAESFGRTVVEAMAAGRPVICYDRGAPPSLVVSGETGFVVPADSPLAVARAVLALDTARLQLSKMSRSARKRARQIQDKALA